MRLVTYYTPSHADMCRTFVLERAAGFTSIIAAEYGQTCPSGAFKSDGWNECMLDKLRCLLDVPTDGQPTLYVDADVALMPGAAEWCETRIASMDPGQVAYSDDVVQWCAGVMLFHSTETVRSWWRLVADLSPIWNIPDQDVIHNLRTQVQQTRGRLPVESSVIPGDRVCNWATIGNRTVWQGERFDVPETCIAWHANWTIGVDAKREMLRRVVSGETSGG